MIQQVQEIQAVIENWCPPGRYANEPFENQVILALLNANACVLDLKRVLDGKEPIRPLESYPIPRK
jgi:hypothetical protein